MSQGVSACTADVVKSEFVQKTCPKQYKAFMDAIDDAGLDQEEVARQTSFEPVEEIPYPVLKAYHGLCRAFKRTTGLSLYFLYHNHEDEGDRYDDEECCGTFWCVGGVRKFTQAGQKFKRHIKECRYVVFC